MDIIKYFHEELLNSEEYKSYKSITDNINTHITNENITNLLSTLGSPLHLIDELRNRTEKIILNIVKHHLRELFIENVFYETTYHTVLIKYSHQTKLYKTNDGYLNAPTCDLVLIDFENQAITSYPFAEVFKTAEKENNDRLEETEREIDDLKEKLNYFTNPNPNKKEISDAFKAYGLDMSAAQGLFGVDKLQKQYEKIKESIEKELYVLETEKIRFNQNDYSALNEAVGNIQKVMLEKLQALNFKLIELGIDVSVLNAPTETEPLPTEISE